MIHKLFFKICNIETLLDKKNRIQEGLRMIIECLNQWTYQQLIILMKLKQFMEKMLIFKEKIKDKIKDFNLDNLLLFKKMFKSSNKDKLLSFTDIKV